MLDFNQINYQGPKSTTDSKKEGRLKVDVLGKKKLLKNKIKTLLVKNK